MLEAAGRAGWLDRDSAVIESLLSLKRGGADLIISYFSEVAARLLPE
jgi:porphobilinogen synthase